MAGSYSLSEMDQHELAFRLARCDANNTSRSGIHQHFQHISAPRSNVGESPAVTFNRTYVPKATVMHDSTAASAAYAAFRPGPLRIAIFSKFKLKQNIMSLSAVTFDLARQSRQEDCGEDQSRST
jgi:hypothetical protein